MEKNYHRTNDVHLEHKYPVPNVHNILRAEIGIKDEMMDRVQKLEDELKEIIKLQKKEGSNTNKNSHFR